MTRRTTRWVRDVPEGIYRYRPSSPEPVIYPAGRPITRGWDSIQVVEADLLHARSTAGDGSRAKLVLIELVSFGTLREIHEGPD
jgi:hypothetical protein